jgi:hypothetical protein
VDGRGVMQELLMVGNQMVPSAAAPLVGDVSEVSCSLGKRERSEVCISMGDPDTSLNSMTDIGYRVTGFRSMYVTWGSLKGISIAFLGRWSMVGVQMMTETAP